MGSLFSHPIRVELWEESSIPGQEAALERALNAELLGSQANGSRAGDRVVFELVIHSGSPPGRGKKKGGGEDGDHEDDNSNVVNIFSKTGLRFPITPEPVSRLDPRLAVLSNQELERAASLRAIRLWLAHRGFKQIETDSDSVLRTSFEYFEHPLWLDVSRKEVDVSEVPALESAVGEFIVPSNPGILHSSAAPGLPTEPYAGLILNLSVKCRLRGSQSLRVASWMRDRGFGSVKEEQDVVLQETTVKGLLPLIEETYRLDLAEVDWDGDLQLVEERLVACFKEHTKRRIETNCVSATGITKRGSDSSFTPVVGELTERRLKQSSSGTTVSEPLGNRHGSLSLTRTGSTSLKSNPLLDRRLKQSSSGAKISESGDERSGSLSRTGSGLKLSTLDTTSAGAERRKMSNLSETGQRLKAVTEQPTHHPADVGKVIALRIRVSCRVAKYGDVSQLMRVRQWLADRGFKPFTLEPDSDCAAAAGVGGGGSSLFKTEILVVRFDISHLRCEPLGTQLIANFHSPRPNVLLNAGIFNEQKTRPEALDVVINEPDKSAVGEIIRRLHEYRGDDYRFIQIRVMGQQLDRGVRREVVRWLESSCVAFKSRTTELKFRVDIGRLRTTERLEHVHVTLEKGEIRIA